MYAALSVNSRWWHREIERNDSTLCFCDDSKVVDKKERNRGWRWQRYGGYEWPWEIRSTTCLIGFRRPHMGVIIRQIGTWTWRVWDGQLTHTRNSLKSQFLMMISPISSDLSLLCSTLPSPKNTKFSHPSLSLHVVIMSKHRVQYHPKIDILRLAASSPSLGGCCTQLSTFFTITSWPMIRVSATVMPPSQSTASKSSSNLAQWWPQSASLSSLDLCLQVHVQTHSITASQWIYIPDRSQPPSASLSLLDLGPQLHLQTRSITASKFISEFTQSLSPIASTNLHTHPSPQSVSLSSLEPSPQMHLRTPLIKPSKYIVQERRWVYRRYRGIGGGMSEAEYIFRRPQGR